MKNLLIYISEKDGFDEETEALAKVQIDNSLDLGWEREDIWIITNFDYQYRGVRAKVFEDIAFFKRKPQASKINAIVKLFEEGMIKEGEMYWFHDFDAYQLCTMEQLIIDLEGADIAVTDYGRNDRWSTGVIYFGLRSKDLFYKIREVVYTYNIDEERALMKLTRGGNRRVKKIDKSFNFTPAHIRTMYPLVVKPLRVAHFHPNIYNPRSGVAKPLEFFKGNNKINTQLIDDRLIKIFEKHGF